MIFGLKMFIARIRFGSNLAALFIRGKSNNMGLPYLIDNSKETAKISISGIKRTYPLSRGDGSDMRWMGMPMYIYDSEDMQNDMAIVYKKDGAYTIVKDGNFIPSETCDVVVQNELLVSEYNKLDAKYKTVYLIVLGILIVCAFNAYTSFELLNYINNI